MERGAPVKETGGSKTPARRYSAHVGGLAVGLLLGVCVLQQRPVYLANVGLRRRLLALAVLVVMLCSAFAWIGAHDPPRDLPWLYPDANDWAHRSCCAKVDACAGLDPDRVGALVCHDRTNLLFHFKEARSCNALRAMLRPATPPPTASPPPS